MSLKEKLGIRHDIIGGPMYPCSNPELVAALSESGGIGVIQPITLTYVYGYELREGIKYVKSLTTKPLGFNALIESSSKRYEKKMREWIDIALDEGIRFFITSLGNPEWVVKKVHAYGGLVYHDVTDAKWAKIAKSARVDGLIAVNNEAGGHVGIYNKAELFRMLKPFGLPTVCAGGIGDKQTFDEAIGLGYAGVQMGTRFIATTECDMSQAYKEAIINAKIDDIVVTKKLTGIDVSVIKPLDDKIQLALNPLLRWALQSRLFKKMTRIWMALSSLKLLKKSRQSGDAVQLWQAGKSVQTIDSVLSVQEVIQSLTQEQQSLPVKDHVVVL